MYLGLGGDNAVRAFRAVLPGFRAAAPERRATASEAWTMLGRDAVVRRPADSDVSGGFPAGDRWASGAPGARITATMDGGLVAGWLEGQEGDRWQVVVGFDGRERHATVLRDAEIAALVEAGLWKSPAIEANLKAPYLGHPLTRETMLAIAGAHAYDDTRRRLALHVAGALRAADLWRWDVALKPGNDHCRALFERVTGHRLPDGVLASKRLLNPLAPGYAPPPV